jgi:MFS family permease
MLRRLKRARPTGALWRHGDFLKLWTGQTISNFGTEITELAIPLVAIIALDASAFEVAALGTVAFAPFILFTLPAGVWVDRLPRRAVLIVGDLGRAVLLASIPLAWALDALTLGQLYVVGFLVGILTVFFDVAYQAYLPSLVDRDELVEGNSKLEITRSGASIAGPGVAGVLISAITAPYAILVDALSYVLSGGFLVRIRKREARPERTSEESRPRLRTELREGLAYVLRHPYLRPQAICTGSSNFCSNLAFSIFLVYAVRELGMSAAAIGIVFALGNVGWLAGAAAAGPIGRRLGVGRATLGAAFLFGPSMLLVPLAPQGFPEPFLVAAVALGGFGSVVYNIQQVSLRQAITPERMQGRMNSVMRFLVWGTIPLGALAGGALGSTIGLRETLFVGAALGSLTFLPILLSPIRSLERIPEPEEPALPTLAADEGVVTGPAPAAVSPDA